MALRSGRDQVLRKPPETGAAGVKTQHSVPRRTKIVCTLGPASRDEATLRGMLAAGMDVARLNCSHGTREEHAAAIAAVRRLAAEAGGTVAILLDLQGPKLRLGEVPPGREVKAGEVLLLAAARPHQTLPLEVLPVQYESLAEEVRPGDQLFLDDGRIHLRVEGTAGGVVRCRVLAGGALRSHAGLNLPGVPLRTPALTAKDREDVLFGLEQGVEYIALSFVRRPEDVTELRALVTGSETCLIAKIEKQEAVDAFEAILEQVDGVMVARGDLGVEIPLEEVPPAQKRIIARCNAAGKPVITATQMLESMIREARPTRAEVSDVANAVWDGSDAVMLSGETAIGVRPVEVVATMDRIVRAAERVLPPRHPGLPRAESVTDAIAQATCEIASELGARAILTSTQSGFTARMIAKYRPAVPIIAVTPHTHTCRRLALVWGVTPLLAPPFSSTDEMVQSALAQVRDAGLAQPGDLVVVTAGVPVGIPGQTNLIQVRTV
jgi:pyruvate kinase